MQQRAARRGNHGRAGAGSACAAEYPSVTSTLLRKLVRRMLSAGKPLKIVLFGSRARGGARPDSDIDLLIVERSRRPRWERSPKYYQVAGEVFPCVDIIVWTPREIREWAAVPNHIVTEALREGKVLYERAC